MTLVRKKINLPLVLTDIFQVIRPTQNKDAVLDLTYQQLLAALSEVFSNGGSITLQTNGVNNPNQSKLNLVEGSNVNIVDDGAGNITISASGSGSSILLQTDGTDNPDQTKLNLVPGTNITITDDGSGNITFNVSASGTGTVTEVSASVPSPSNPAFSVTVNTPTTTPDIVIGANGSISQYVRGDGSLASFPSIPSVGTWGALNYPTWISGTPFVKMTAAGTFALDLNTYLTDAPSDGTTYGRKDGAWTAIASSGGIKNGVASGTDTYTVSITGVTSYADGDAYLIRFTNGNTTGCTLNINSLGAVTLYRNNDGALIGGDILAGGEMLCVYNSSSNVFQCIGTAPNTLLAYVTNADSVTITKGQPVYAFSGTGDRMTVKRALNTSDATSAQTVGIVLSSSIAANQKGIIITQGLLDGLSILPTSTWADGDPVYLGATAGAITNVKPYAPNHLVYLGFVTTASNGSAGRMYVRVQNGYELDELHNVAAQSPADKDGIFFNTSTQLWENKSIGTVLGGSTSQYVRGDGSLASFPSIPSVGTWGALNYPTWVSGTPFVKMTAAGTFALDLTSYYPTPSGTTAQYVRGDGSLATLPIPSDSVDILGDGSDGSVAMNGSTTYNSFSTLAGSTYTLIRDIYPQDLTISSGVTLNTAGFNIMCRGTFTVNGTVGSVGNNGANGGAGTGSAAAGGISLFTNQTTFYTSLNPVFTGTTATGGNGGAGANTSFAAGSKTVNTRYFGGIGGAGGNGNTATSGAATGLVLGGTVTLITGGQFNPLGAIYTLPQNLLQGNQVWNSSWPGAGGGVGQNFGGAVQGGGGGGGSSPFGLVIFCKTLTIGGSGLIRSNGGNGGNGGNASGGSGTGGGGGGGGGGGRVWITIQSTLNYTLASNQIQAKGGTGGTGGAGTGTQAGNLSYSGSNGGDGYVTLRILSAGTTTTYTGQI